MANKASGAPMTAQEELIQYLKQMVDFFEAPMCPLERFILECGQDFKPAKRPKGLRKMTDKQCYRNATVLSRERGLHYAEGFAASIIPVLHAWCVDDNGTVIDPTWRHPETAAYRGFIIPQEILAREILRNGYYGVLGQDIIDIKLIERLRTFHLANQPKLAKAASGGMTS